MGTLENLPQRTELNTLAEEIRQDLRAAQSINDTSWHDLFTRYVNSGRRLLTVRGKLGSNRQFGDWVQAEGLWRFGDRKERHALMVVAINANRIERLATETTRLTERRTARTIIMAVEDLIEATGGSPLDSITDAEETEAIVQPLDNDHLVRDGSPQATESSTLPPATPPESPTKIIAPPIEVKTATSKSVKIEKQTEDERILMGFVPEVAAVLLETYPDSQTRRLLAQITQVKYLKAGTRTYARSRDPLTKLATVIQAHRLGPITGCLRKVSPRLLGDDLPKSPSYDPDDRDGLISILRYADDYVALAAAIRANEVTSDADSTAKWLMLRRQRRWQPPAPTIPLAAVPIVFTRRLASQEGEIVFWGKQLWPPTDALTQQGWTFDVVFAAYHFYLHVANNLATKNPHEQTLTISQFCKWLEQAEAGLLVSVLQQMIGAVRLAHGDPTKAGKTIAPPLMPFQ